MRYLDKTTIFLLNFLYEISDNLTTSVVDPKITTRKYSEARIIVLDDNFNTFEHVANCLVRIIPGISEKNHG